MSDSRHSTETIIGATGDVAKGVVTSLGTSPIFLVVVLLNLCFCGAAAWFLNTVSGTIHTERMLLLDRCLPGKDKP